MENDGDGTNPKFEKKDAKTFFFLSERKVNHKEVSHTLSLRIFFFFQNKKEKESEKMKKEEVE